MKKICIITTSRADWGYLFWLCHDLQANDKFNLQIILPFNHHNFDAIAKEFTIYPANAVKSIKDFGQFYSDCYKIMLDTKPDMVIVLGDRFEMLAAASAALLLNTPIIHMYGGECTFGAFDNEIRNAITQMADIHFAATEEYAQNIAIMKGLFREGLPGSDFEYFINPENKLVKNDLWNHVFNVGSTGLDWLHRTKLLSKQELQQYVSIDLNEPFAIACYHPVTHELKHTKEHIKSLLNALDSLDMQFVFIRPNCDPTNDIISDSIDEYWKKYDGVNCDGMPLVMITRNLDHLVYLSLLQYASFMIGNSSSGIIESASFNLPTINVGNRQAGRLRNANVFDCKCETEDILHAVDRAREWNALVGKCENLYGDGHSTERIIKILEEI